MLFNVKMLKKNNYTLNVHLTSTILFAAAFQFVHHIKRKTA